MSNAVLIAILSCGGFFTVGLVTGIWKYRKMVSSPKGKAPAYVDICHRSALMYSFACLVLAKFAELSAWSSAVNIASVVAAITFFTTAVLIYAVHGWLNNTENMLERPPGVAHSAGVHGYVTLVVLGELGGFLVLFSGFLKSLLA
ncbi:hypothetical protein CH352_02415 [Leptospira hartskeerlii]|uniref:Uncharacterized protein n=1 Tax=Leptospira hartskeerlii TaxID=2023177 RepID=A0A2M9XDH6_9LEPT|nr:hypothetical protein [Leptospira hartskeerlii]PJZ25694.1 hypothetical protein CH357_08560 [Leptospira hartskeerlii]PJZ35483.1 hypothetical protein CH352_02415 [Leptospira hartskeerlii]